MPHYGFTQSIHSDSTTPIYRQVVELILQSIKERQLKKGERLPSVNYTSKSLKIAPGTVIKAFEELKRMGIVESSQGKAYYVTSENVDSRLNIFVLVDRVTNYKEILYNAFIDSFNSEVNIDFNFYNYDLKKFESLIEANLGHYHFYVIMAYFNADVTPIVSKIPLEQLIVFNSPILGLKGKYAGVFQNYKKDVYSCLLQAKSLLEKYSTLTLVLDTKNRFQFVPEDVVLSFKKACRDIGINHSIMKSLDINNVQKGHAYFIISDTDLAQLIKHVEEKEWSLGSELGIIAYDETPVREIMAGGITVLSTDFRLMGITAARLIKENSKEIIENPCSLIVRKSL